MPVVGWEWYAFDTHGIIVLALVGLAACAGSTEVEPQVVAQVAQQAQGDVVTVLTVEGMT